MKDNMLNDCLAILPLVADAFDLLVPGPEVPRLRLRRRRQVEEIVFDDALGSSSSSSSLVIRAFLLPFQIGQLSILNTLSANKSDCLSVRTDVAFWRPLLKALHRKC